MTLERAIYLLRLHLNDEQSIGWPSDDELIEYMDRATSFLTDRLITMRYNSLIKSMQLDGPTELPADFVAFVGRVPVKVIGNTATAYGKIDIHLHDELWKDPNIPINADRMQWKGDGKDYVPWSEYTKTTKTSVYYWGRLPFPSTFEPTDELPYTQDQATLILDLARQFALNKNEYDLTQDISIMSQIQTAMAQARGVVVEGG